MKSVAASHVENSGMVAQSATPLHRTPSLQRAADAIDESKTFRREVERVVVLWVDSRQLTGRRAGIQIHQPTPAASHGDERICAASVLEVLADGGRRTVFGAADAAGDVRQFQSACAVGACAIHRRGVDRVERAGVRRWTCSYILDHIHECPVAPVAS